MTRIHALAVALALAACAGSAGAGTPADYPEYPYLATDYREPLRGQFHFSPQSGWMNDVNGPVYYRGTYHLFYQHNPHGREWDTMHWGHATSTDLVRWTQQPIALEPGVQSDERQFPQAMYSGSAWVDTGNVTGLKAGSDDPMLLFHNTDGVSISYSTDGGRTFQAWQGGARVIATTSESRDPKVQWDPARNRWVMVLWQAGLGATFYTSTNLLSWAWAGNYNASWFFECPDLFLLPVDGNPAQMKWVLHDASGEYVIGTLAPNGRFVSDWATPQQMDKGTAWYAAQTFNQLPGNRIVQMGWQPGNRGATWTGNASFPVELALKTVPGVGIRLVRNPIGEIASLRTETRVWLQRTVSADPATNPMSTLSADTYELQAEFDLAATTATEFGFQLHRRANGSSDVQLAYNTGARTLAGRPLEGVNPAGRLRLRVLVDRGQLEVFGNDGVLAITDNVNFDAGSGAQGLAVYARDGTARLVSLTFHRLGSIWSPTRGGNTIRPAAAAGKCVDRDMASGIVQVWDCNGVGHQYWTLGDDGSLSTAGSCMQTAPGETANFTLVQVAACIGSAHEKWRQDTTGAIIHQASGRCLDVRDADYANGRQLQIHDCVGSPNQQWKPLVHVPGTGRLAWSGSNACVDRDVASGRVQIWQCLGGGNQAWTPTASGSLSTDTQNGKVCMQLPEGQTGNHALVNVAPCTGRANQAWSRNRDGSWMNIAAGRCLDLDVGDTSNGRQLQVWDCIPGGGNQRWDWRPWP